MTTERERMISGELYDPADPELRAARVRARTLCQQFNALPADAVEARRALLSELLGRPTTAFITPPFQCDYGTNIELGDDVYFNVNCVVLDVAPVRIGARTMFGPAAQIYAATHPMSVAERRTGRELGRPVTIGEDVWVGGHTVICPGVTIGDGTIVGAGSVVTRDLPAGVVAAGNPCRVIRTL